MTIYLIYSYNSYGNRDLVAITDNPDEWLKENNKQRTGDGNEPEKITDFQIIEHNVEIFNKEVA